jgi:DNA-binding transcriptional LysR family regulator
MHPREAQRASDAIDPDHFAAVADEIGREKRDISRPAANVEHPHACPDTSITYSERPFDLGVVGIPLKHATVETEPLFEMPCTAIMRRDHPLAKRSFVRASDLKGERIVALEAGTRRGDEMEEVFAAEAVPLKPQFTVTNLDIACQLVLKVNAITVDEPWVPLALDSRAYALVPLKPHRKVAVGIVTPLLKPESRLTAAFKTCLGEEAHIVENRLAHYFKHRFTASRRRGE